MMGFVTCAMIPTGVRSRSAVIHEWIIFVNVECFVLQSRYAVFLILDVE